MEKAKMNRRKLTDEELEKVTGGDVDPETLAAMTDTAKRAKERVLYLESINASPGEIEEAKQALNEIKAQINAYINGTT